MSELRVVDRHRCGLTLVEMVISIAIVSVMLVAALNTVGASQMTQKKMGDRNRGMLLAQDLMSEILRQDYADASFGPDSFGRSAAEVAPGNRSLYDDVDDYAGWSSSPPQYKDGTVMSDLTGWGRRVQVAWVDPSDIGVPVVSNQGAKRISVTVTHDGLEVSSLTAIRTQARDRMEQ